MHRTSQPFRGRNRVFLASRARRVYELRLSCGECDSPPPPHCRTQPPQGDSSLLDRPLDRLLPLELELGELQVPQPVVVLLQVHVAERLKATKSRDKKGVNTTRLTQGLVDELQFCWPRVTFCASSSPPIVEHDLHRAKTFLVIRSGFSPPPASGRGHR